MSQADLNAAPNMPLPPPNELAGSGTSAFAVLVAMSLLVMVTFFALSFVAVWKRSEARTAPPATGATAIAEMDGAVQSPTTTSSEEWRKGFVSVPRLDMKNGVLRSVPGFNTPVAALVPNGTLVDVGRSTTKDGQTWYRVLANVNGKVYEGWMHSDIVKLVVVAIPQ